MSNPMLQLIVLAAIAVFLILRLRNVLGTRDGFEPPRIPDAPAARQMPADLAAPVDEEDITDHVEASSPAAHALEQMKFAEPSFTVGPFLLGARQAYEMILTAFERGDLSEVRPFLAPAVAEAFDQAIAARAERGITTEVQYLGTRETTLAEANYNAETQEGDISVRFVGELIVAHRDASGAVIEGDPRAARKQRDVWTFARRMGDPDPNWRLVATA
ncbi:Tim44/TimA family putative adaptor protein [Paracoccus sp. Z118]|uniref:Tim44/TimA family putative adaptor protein n=1 Tax=Paracoccus sp. Z118 TaxID=2851017 RepID=UPI001C2BF477|nr:Tim44/TimA family putative adaptor protein [Paracoccus sp. Z118]MBV0891240.1 Tim44/TimA family putative adaptor protein [Paracoccus sp. Z118]